MTEGHAFFTPFCRNARMSPGADLRNNAADGVIGELRVSTTEMKQDEFPQAPPAPPFPSSRTEPATARIIDGKALSKQLQEGFKPASAPRGPGRHPGLAVILGDNRPAGSTGNKVKACEEVGGVLPHCLAGRHAGVGSPPPSPALNADPPCMVSSSSCPCRPTLTGRRCWEAIQCTPQGSWTAFRLYNVADLIVGNTIFPLPCTPTACNPARHHRHRRGRQEWWWWGQQHRRQAHGP